MAAAAAKVPVQVARAVAVEGGARRHISTVPAKKVSEPAKEPTEPAKEPSETGKGKTEEALVRTATEKEGVKNSGWMDVDIFGLTDDVSRNVSCTRGVVLHADPAQPDARSIVRLKDGREHSLSNANLRPSAVWAFNVPHDKQRRKTAQEPSEPAKEPSAGAAPGGGASPKKSSKSGLDVFRFLEIVRFQNLFWQFGYVLDRPGNAS